MKHCITLHRQEYYLETFDYILNDKKIQFSSVYLKTAELHTTKVVSLKIKCVFSAFVSAQSSRKQMDHSKCLTEEKQCTKIGVVTHPRSAG